MRKIDYEILAAAIKKHGLENTATPLHYANADQAAGAKICADRIARTFARFASVKKDEFLTACGITQQHKG